MECKCIQGIWVNTDVCRELIETLWNVNYITEEQAQKINEGINRNIVECKYDEAGKSGRKTDAN